MKLITFNGKVVKTNTSILSMESTSPVLNAPILKIASDKNSMQIKDSPLVNGNFVKSFDVMVDSSVIGNVLKEGEITKVELTDFVAPEGTYNISVKAKGNLFEDSLKSNEIESDIFMWCEPILENGQLIIRQTFEDTQEESILTLN